MDLTQLVGSREIEYKLLPRVAASAAAMKPGSALVHEEFGDNIVMRVTAKGS